MNEIIEKTACLWSVNASDIYSKSRTAQISEARDACIYLIKQKLKVSNAKIGLTMGFRLPSTIVYSLKRTKERLEAGRPQDELFKDRLTMASSRISKWTTN